MFELMAELNHESNSTLVMVTNDREVALRADYIYELVDGKICKFLDLKKTGKTGAEKAIEDQSCSL